MMPARRSQNWLPGIFNDFFGNEWVEKTNTASPAINIIESDNDYKVEVAAPGMTKDDFSIKIDPENQLIVSMEKKTENDEKDKKGKYLRREFSYSRFQQIMVLPENVEKDKIDAKVENGVLTIDIPKKVVEPEEKRMKEIAIKYARKRREALRDEERDSRRAAPLFHVLSRRGKLDCRYGRRGQQIVRTEPAGSLTICRPRHRSDSVRYEGTGRPEAEPSCARPADRASEWLSDRTARHSLFSGRHRRH